MHDDRLAGREHAEHQPGSFRAAASLIAGRGKVMLARSPRLLIPLMLLIATTAEGAWAAYVSVASSGPKISSPRARACCWPGMRPGASGCRAANPAFSRAANPTPATTCGNGPLAENSRLRGPFFSVPWCVTLGRRRALCCGIHGKLADGVRAARTVGVTVGFSRTATDGPRCGAQRLAVACCRWPAGPAVRAARAPPHLTSRLS
jgi:hypothetical protein